MKKLFLFLFVALSLIGLSAFAKDVFTLTVPDVGVLVLKDTKCVHPQVLMFSLLKGAPVEQMKEGTVKFDEEPAIRQLCWVEMGVDENGSPQVGVVDEYGDSGLIPLVKNGGKTKIEDGPSDGKIRI